MKKFIMKNIWRFSQAGQFLSLFFWSIALTGIVWPIIKENMLNFLNPISIERANLIGLSLLFIGMLSLIFILGFIYDKTKMWKEQTIISVERNPFANERLSPKEFIMLEIYISLLHTIPQLYSLEMKLENWVQRQAKENPSLLSDVEKLWRYME